MCSRISKNLISLSAVHIKVAWSQLDIFGLHRACCRLCRNPKLAGNSNCCNKSVKVLNLTSPDFQKKIGPMNRRSHDEVGTHRLLEVKGTMPRVTGKEMPVDRDKYWPWEGIEIMFGLWFQTGFMFNIVQPCFGMRVPNDEHILPAGLTFALWDVCCSPGDTLRDEHCQDNHCEFGRVFRLQQAGWTEWGDVFRPGRPP